MRGHSGRPPTQFGRIRAAGRGTDPSGAGPGDGADGAWLDAVRSAAVRLTSGCSASVVSKEGLVLTNHHCVVECEQTLSTAEQDYVSTGFLTHKRQEERLCPGMQAEILRHLKAVYGLICLPGLAR